MSYFGPCVMYIFGDYIQPTRINYHIYIYKLIIVVCPSVRPLPEVSGNDLTSRQKMLYLWLPSVRGYSRAISMRVSHCTSHRQEGQFTGRAVQKISYIGFAYL